MIQTIASILLVVWVAGMIIFAVGLVHLQKQIGNLASVPDWANSIGRVIGVIFTSFFWPVVLGRVMIAHNKRRA